MKIKTIIIESVWLITTFVLVTVLIYIMLKIKSLSQLKYDIELYDTYLEFNWRVIILLPFLFSVVIIYLVKESFYRFKRMFQNAISVVLHFILIERLLDLMLFMSFYQHPSNTNGWTIYPPIITSGRAMPNAVAQVSEELDKLYEIKTALFFVVLFFILTLIFVSVMMGINLRYTTNE